MHLLTFGFFNYLIVIFLCTLIDQSFASERLDLPVAFPIFRPPLEAVHRYKTSAEHLQRHSSLNNTNTQLEIEEISTNFNNNTSEPSLEGLLGEEEEEALITAEKFREEKINKNNSLVKQHLFNNNTSENIQNLKNLKNETKLRHLNNSINATNVINTPRFPVFTGLGMEIIDSPSNDAETENKFKEEISPSPHQHHHKLHYHLNNKNNTKLNKKYYPLKLNKELTTTTLIPFIQLLPSTIKTFPKHFEENKQIKEENNPFILKQNLSEQNYLNKTNNYLNNSEGEDFESFNLINGTEWNEFSSTGKSEFLENKTAKNINNLTIIDEDINITTTIITPLPSTEVHVTENIFAFSDKNNENKESSPSSSSQLHSTTTTNIPIEDFGRPNIRDELDNGFERVTMHLDIPSITELPVNNGSIIERPSQPEETTTQNILTFNGIPFNLPSAKTPPKIMETTSMPSNTLNVPSINDKNELIDNLQQKELEFPQINTNHLIEVDELINERNKNENLKINGNNNLENNNKEIEENNKENSVDGNNLNKNGEIGESMKRTSKFSTSTNSSDNLRIFVLLGIITILLVTIAFGSIFSARYVKRSRQLHGKYQPAAYEMQTQQQNRYQTTDFVNTQIYRQPNNITPSPSISPTINNLQKQITATFGKEERLI